MAAGGAALSEAQDRLIRSLASGEIVSGAELARILGVSRTAVWNRLRRLAVFGVDVAAVRGRGYRLDLSALDTQAT
jgi:BirA family biotin operon repressor/biotin-[acetyl-CoA-carboxylase] ligase